MSLGLIILGIIGIGLGVYGIIDSLIKGQYHWALFAFVLLVGIGSGTYKAYKRLYVNEKEAGQK